MSDGYWWCGRCKEEVAPKQVTFNEYHENCGHSVEWITPEEANHVRDLESRLAAETARADGLEREVERLEFQLSIKTEFLRTRQCADHSGKWERGRCLQCEREAAEAKLRAVEGLPEKWIDEQLMNEHEDFGIIYPSGAKTPQDCADELQAALEWK